MGGVTIAHQITTNDNDSYSLDEGQLNQLLANDWSNNLPVVEDLTGEVEDLMMRESVQSWLQPWSEENNACISDLMYAQSMQLDLFGQDQLTQAAIYEKIPYADDSSVNLSTSTSSASSPSDTSANTSPVVEKSLDIHIETNDIPIVENLVIEETNPLKRRRSSVSSDSSSSDSSSEEEEESEKEDNIVIPTTVANMNSRGRMNYSSDSDSDSDSEMMSGRRRAAPINSPYMYMHKRQIEETLLDRITNSLEPEKLPGILPILSPENNNNQQDDEIEIDLSCLAREQLVQVLLYVDACILEQNGGPRVHVEDFIQKKKGPRRPTLVQNDKKKRNVRRRPRMPKTKTRAELTEDIDAESSSSSSDDEIEHIPKSKANSGPISMASLSKKKDTCKSRRKTTSSSTKRKSRRRLDDDALVSSSVTVIQDPDSIASSRPKRRAAVHKRRLLEEMLAPTDDESDEEDDGTTLVVYGDEKMDFGIVDNQTIAHQADAPVIEVVLESPVSDTNNNEDTDEEIDIMF